MAVTASASGTQSATVTTEHQLADTAAAGTYTLHVDTVNMVAGDVVELRIYQMVLTSGTSRVTYIQRYAGAQPTDDLIKISVPISNELTDSTALRFSLKQTFGTSRNFPWKVLKYA
jgi:hypothetical protein